MAITNAFGTPLRRSGDSGDRIASGGVRRSRVNQKRSRPSFGVQNGTKKRSTTRPRGSRTVWKGLGETVFWSFSGRRPSHLRRRPSHLAPRESVSVDHGACSERFWVRRWCIARPHSDRRQRVLPLPAANQPIRGWMTAGKGYCLCQRRPIHTRTADRLQRALPLPARKPAP